MDLAYSIRHERGGDDARRACSISADLDDEPRPQSPHKTINKGLGMRRNQRNAFARHGIDRLSAALELDVAGDRLKQMLGIRS